MGGADGGERHADGTDGEPVIGAAHDVHGDGVGVGGERLAAEAAAPGVVAAPGRAVGAAGAVAAGAGGVERGAAGQFFQLGGAGGAVGHGSGPSKVLQRVGAIGPRRPVRSRGRAARGAGRGVWPAGGAEPGAGRGGALWPR